MKVYIVTYGSYSDYGIDAVFLDREKAAFYCDVHNKGHYDEHRIEEWDTKDDSIDLAKGYRFEWKGTYYCDGVLNMTSDGKPTLADFDVFNVEGGVIRFTIVTHKDCTYEQAEKIAYDKIAQFLAEGMENDAVAAFIERKKQKENQRNAMQELVKDYFMFLDAVEKRKGGKDGDV